MYTHNLQSKEGFFSARNGAERCRTCLDLILDLTPPQQGVIETQKTRSEGDRPAAECS